MNINIDMGEVLTKAWKIIWKFKVLWIFGILAGCGSSNGSNFNSNFSNGGGGGNGGDGNLPEPFRQFQNMRPEEAIRSFIGQYLTIIVVVTLLLCVLWFLFFFLGIMGKTGLIKGANKADAGAEKLTFGELWTESLPYFWRMVGLSLLIGLPFFIIIVVLLVVLFVGLFGMANGDSNGGALAGLIAALGVFVPAICCLGILRIAVGMIVEQAHNAIVLEDKGVLESLGRGWDIFKRNIFTVVLMAIILAVLGGIVGFIIALPPVLIFAPVIAGFALGAVSGPGAATIPFIIAGLCILAYLPVLLIVSGIERAYLQSAWTLTYLRLTAPAAPAAALPSVETADAA